MIRKKIFNFLIYSDEIHKFVEDSISDFENKCVLFSINTLRKHLLFVRKFSFAIAVSCTCWCEEEVYTYFAL